MKPAPFPTCAEDHRTGLADAVIAEIAGHLARLAADGDYAEVIDLRSLPMTDADRAELAERLGSGEVAARLDVAGESRVEETGFSGVWRVTHIGGDGKVAAEQIEIARIPAILVAHPDDIAAACRKLEEIRSPDTGSRPTSKEVSHG